MTEAFEEQLDALSTLDALKKEVDCLKEAREANSPRNAQISRNNRGKLKSDMKKSTSFVKKIRALTPESLQQCIRDAETLNLALYVSEIVAALLECKFKFNDIPGVVKLCGVMHLRYDDFTEPLLSGLKESLLQVNNEGKKKRLQIRWLIELFQVGIFTEENFFRQLIRFIVGKQTKDSAARENAAIDLNALVTYVKYGAEVLMGYTPHRLVEVARQAGKTENEIPSKLLLSLTLQNEVILQVSQASEKLASDLIEAHKDVCNRQRKNEKDKILHGSLSEQKQAEFDNATKLYEKLLSSLTSIQEATGRNLLPELKDDTEEEEGKSGISLHVGGGTGSDLSFGPYGDAESRAFYEDLPDLLSLVPLAVLGLTPEQANEMRVAWKTEKEHRDIEDTGQKVEDSNPESVEPETTSTIESDNIKDNSQDFGEDDGILEEDMNAYLSIQSSYVKDVDANEEQDEKDETNDETGEKSTARAKILVLLEETLPSMVTKEHADEFCVSYCFVNTKRARKKLISALAKLPRNRFDLIPLYARVTASLARLYPDIVPPILDSLHKEFYGMYKAKNQLQVEGKLKNIRFVGELVKFRVAPPILAFKLFKKLLSDFHHHNVDLVATLLETCGRFLYLLPVTNARLEGVLDTVMRHRRGRNMDLRHQQVLEAAYFIVKPPERHVAKKKEYTDIQKYARYLFFSKLASNNVDYVIKQLRKLPWDNEDENIEEIVVKSSMKLSRKKYTNVPLVTDCLSGIAKFHPNVVVRLVDVIFEEITRGMSSSHKTEQQRLLTYVRLIGELYNFSSLPAATVFDLLYFFLTHGYKNTGLFDIYSQVTTGNSMESPSSPPGKIIDAIVRHYSNHWYPLVPTTDTQSGEEQSGQLDKQLPYTDMDPPSNFFRIQMVCELLNTSAMYFMRGLMRLRLEEYLLYFQRYLLSKPMLPSHVEFAVLDTYDNLEHFARAELRRSLKSSAVSKEKGNTKKKEEVQAMKEMLLSSKSCFVRCSTFKEAEMLILSNEDKKRKEEELTKQRINAYYSMKEPSASGEDGSTGPVPPQEGSSVSSKQYDDEEEFDDFDGDDDDDDDADDDDDSYRHHKKSLADEEEEDDYEKGACAA